MGSDSQVATADGIRKIFGLVAARSDRSQARRHQPDNRRPSKTIAAIISAPENLRNLDQIRRVNQRLATIREGCLATTRGPSCRVIKRC
jgi:hypothetical protein